MTRRWALACGMLAAASIAACSDNDESIGPEGRDDFARFVSIGTSVSMGTQSDGVVYEGQELSWTAQLARAANVTYTMPLIAAPGCNAPLIAPLSFGLRLGGSLASAQTNKLTCAANIPGVVLPTNNVALDGASTYRALRFTPESLALKPGARPGDIGRRVLLPGQTQVTAMLAQSPTFVSLELGANEVLGVTSGLVAPGVTYVPVAAWQPDYDAIVDSIKLTGAKVVVAGLLNDVASFPSLRTGDEIWANRAAFAAFNVAVGAECQGSANLLFTPTKVGGAVAAGQARAAQGLGPAPLSCNDAPGTVDYVLTPADVGAVAAVLAEMNQHIQDVAAENGWAYFELAALYEQPKIAFTLTNFLTGTEPHGPYVSLDGVHPSSRGQRILAAAAAAAINSTYGFAIDVPIEQPVLESVARR